MQTDDRQRVLDATDIVQLVGEHVRLQAKGREFVGLCPFHDDHKPSLYVVPAKQIYHCFSCGAGGNALDFVINYHKMEFLQALRHLAERANITLSRRSADDSSAQTRDGVRRADLLAANTFALEFFRLKLTESDVGAEARRLIEARGITTDMVDRFQLGAAADSWDALLSAAQKKGVSAKLLIAAGLAKPPKDGRGDGYDAQRHRLIFPIFDQIGRPIAFGGRTLNKDEEPKYLNSPESAVFDKSSTLYGLHLASREIQRQGFAIVTEGYTDVIACHQAGFANAVGTLGTALTPKHARILQRLCSSIVLVFDGDEAGAKAADRAVKVFFSQPVDVKIAVLPTGSDPADLLGSPEGKTQFQAALDRSREALEFRFDRLRGRLAHAGLSERSTLLEEEMAQLNSLGLDRLPILRRRLVIRRLADLAGVAEDAIVTAMAHAGSHRRPADPAAGAEPTTAPEERSPAAHALGALLADPSLRNKLSADQQDILDPDAYAPGSLQEIARALAGACGESDTPGTAWVIEQIRDEKAKQLAARLVGAVLRETAGDTNQLETHFLQCARRTELQFDVRRQDEPLIKSESEDTVDDASIVKQLERRRQVMAKYGCDPLARPRVVGSTPD